MKKRLVVVLAALMMLSTTTFLAVESPSTNVTVKLFKGPEGVVLSTDTNTADLQNYLDDAAEAAAEANADIVAMIDFDIQNNTSGAAIEITVEIPVLTQGDTVNVYHYDTLIATTTAGTNGSVTFNTPSGSPFYFAKVATSAPQPSTNDTTATLPPYNPNVWPWNEIIAREEAAKAAQNAATDATLPKTGAVAVLPFAAMACLAGAVVCGRKEK